MKYSFSETINRKGHKSLKWDRMKSTFHSEDLLPFWVADADFKAAPAIISALRKIADHGVYGYTFLDDDYFEAVAKWWERRNGWKIPVEWIVPSCGVVTALSVTIRALTEKGDKVLIQTPVYGPFYSVVNVNERELVENPLIFNGVRYEIDFDDLKAKCADGVKMILLCSPHNPVGRVWEKSEMEKLHQICDQYGIILVSDEIHSDLIYKGYRHLPAGNFPGYSDHTIVCAAASKSFNIAGLQTSNCIIPDEKLRNKFIKELHSSFIPEPNILGVTATQVAYNDCEKWLDDQLEYLENNRDILCEYFIKNIPEIKVIRPEATYLAWLDFRSLGVTNDQLMKLLAEKGKIALSSGMAFGGRGEGFMRFNFACPLSLMEEGLERIKMAIHN